MKLCPIINLIGVFTQSVLKRDIHGTLDNGEFELKNRKDLELIAKENGKTLPNLTETNRYIMSTKINSAKVFKILDFHILQEMNKAQVSRALKISRGSVTKYVGYYERSTLGSTDLRHLDSKSIMTVLEQERDPQPIPTEKFERAELHFSTVHSELLTEESTLKFEWEKYLSTEKLTYSYSMFCTRYHEWRKKNNVEAIVNNRWKIERISEDDLRTLRKWRRSSDRRKWEKSVALLGLYKSQNISHIAKKIDRSIRTVQKWFNKFVANGVAGLDLGRKRKIPDGVKKGMEEKAENIMKLIHETPSLHNINRSSWSLKSLTEAYEGYYGESISMSTVSKYIHQKGYSFKRAKVVLTSPDPDYREKLDKIKLILSNLRPNEKFFSIDEYWFAPESSETVLSESRRFS